MLPPDLSDGSSSRAVDVELETFESDVGLMRQLSLPSMPNRTRQIEFLLESRDKINDMIAFLNLLAGRYTSFWLPTWNDDLFVLSAVLTSITIRDIGFTEHLNPSRDFQHIMIVDKLNPANVWWRYAAPGSSVDNGDGTETLSAFTDFPYPGDFNGATSANCRFMFVQLVRLDTDEVEIEYLNGEAATVSLSVIHVPEEA